MITLFGDSAKADYTNTMTTRKQLLKLSLTTPAAALYLRYLFRRGLGLYPLSLVLNRVRTVSALPA